MEKDHTGRRRVGLAFDERMCKHKQIGGKHPENPDRIRAIWDNLKDSAILQRCVVLNPRIAEDDQLALVHTKDHIDLIKNISSKRCRKMSHTANRYNSIYFNKGSSEAAYLAAGFVIEATEQVAKGELNSAFAIVRPPGHHAEQSEPMGFCLLNNVAIATSVILDQRPELDIKKILIVDWDVHHGNSTQKMFYNDPRVLVFSVHRHDSGSFYPEGNDGSYNMVGEGLGAGYNINVPWEGGGVGDADYIAVWDHILLPVARKFDPDLVIISAGFDAAAGDPIGGCCVSPHGYTILLYKLMGFAGGKIVMALEGGYNLISLANATQACIEMLLDCKPPITSLEDLPLKPTWPLIKTVRQTLCMYWPILAAKIPDKIRHDKVYTQTPTVLEHAQVSVREDYFEGMDRNRRMDKTKEVMGLKQKEAERKRKHGSPSKRVVKQRVTHKKGKIVPPTDSSSETDTRYTPVNETSELRRSLGKKIVKKGAFDDLLDTSTSDCSEDDMQPRNRLAGLDDDDGKPPSDGDAFKDTDRQNGLSAGGSDAPKKAEDHKNGHQEGSTSRDQGKEAEPMDKDSGNPDESLSHENVVHPTANIELLDLGKEIESMFKTIYEALSSLKSELVKEVTEEIMEELTGLFKLHQRKQIYNALMSSKSCKGMRNWKLRI